MPLTIVLCPKYSTQPKTKTMTTEHKILYTADLNFTTYSASKENNPESEAVPTLAMQN